MGTLRRAAAAAALAVLAMPGPVFAAPADPADITDVMQLRATLAKLAGDRRDVSATDVSDHFAGGPPLAAGSGHTCSVVMMRPGWCWGDNADGQLGDGSTDDATEPAEVAIPGDYLNAYPVAVVAGRAHTCTLDRYEDGTGSGSLWCWGANSDGQLGDGTTTSRSAPVPIATGISRVAAGADHTCAITGNGGVECWGANDKGQLGIGTTGAAQTEPQAVPGLTDIVDLSAGGDTTCALDSDGAARCWGSDEHGQVGDGGGISMTPVDTPVPVTISGAGFQAVEVGARHACAIDNEDALAWCWGDDTSGQLGDADAAADQSRPVEVALDDNPGISSISAGDDSTCAVSVLAVAYCWGANASGQLGTGDRTDRDAPAEVDRRNVPYISLLTEAGDALLGVTVGAEHACAYDIGGNAFCWGSNAEGQIGDGTTADALVPVGTTLLTGPVTDVRVNPGDSSLEVAWSPPDEPGTGEFLEYLAVAFDQDGEAVSLCKAFDDLSCAIPDLINGRQYQVSVLAITWGGLSTSEVIPGIPVGRASAPPDIRDDIGVGLPITGAALSLIIAVGGGLVVVGLALVRSVRHQARR